MADNNNNTNINANNNVGNNDNQGGGQAVGDGGGSIPGGCVHGVGPGYVAGGNQPFGFGGFDIGGAIGGQQVGYSGYPGNNGGIFNANVGQFGMEPFGGMAGQQNYGMNNFDGNYGSNFGVNNGMYGAGMNNGMVGGMNNGMGNFVMGALGNLQHHAGFGPAPGPGTFGCDADGNVFMPNGQYAPGGYITLEGCFTVCGFAGNEIAIITNNLPDFNSIC
jgi:hypothetical protein